MVHSFARFRVGLSSSHPPGILGDPGSQTASYPRNQLKIKVLFCDYDCECPRSPSKDRNGRDRNWIARRRPSDRRHERRTWIGLPGAGFKWRILKARYRSGDISASWLNDGLPGMEAMRRLLRQRVTGSRTRFPELWRRAPSAVTWSLFSGNAPGEHPVVAT